MLCIVVEPHLGNLLCSTKPGFGAIRDFINVVRLVKINNDLPFLLPLELVGHLAIVQEGKLECLVESNEPRLSSPAFQKAEIQSLQSAVLVLWKAYKLC